MTQAPDPFNAPSLDWVPTEMWVVATVEVLIPVVVLWLIWRIYARQK